MPWTKTAYPESMKYLREDIRNRAIDIANDLMEERGMDESFAIATAIDRAEAWARHRGIPSKVNTGSEKSGERQNK